MALIIDPTVPPGSEAISLGDNRIRAFEQGVCDIFGVPPSVTLDGASGKIDTTGQAPLHVRLSNQTGGDLAIGDVVCLSTSLDKAVVLGNVAASLNTFVVTREAIVSGATGLFAIAGVIATVNTTGTVNRGEYLRKSATTKVVESTGVVENAGVGQPIGAVGLALTASAGNVCTAYWYGAGGSASAAFNTVLVRLNNSTGVTLVSGDVVTLSGIADNTAILDDTASALGPYVVAAETIANAAAGYFVQSGIVVTTSAGAIARGAYVRKSATTKAIETTGVTRAAATVPPHATLGLALTAAAGGVTTCLWYGYQAMPRAVQLAGDTMTGLLVLSGDPVVALGAATKQYVDAGSGSGLTAGWALHGKSDAEVSRTTAGDFTNVITTSIPVGTGFLVTYSARQTGGSGGLANANRLGLKLNTNEVLNNVAALVPPSVSTVSAGDVVNITWTFGAWDGTYTTPGYVTFGGVFNNSSGDRSVVLSAGTHGIDNAMPNATITSITPTLLAVGAGSPTVFLKYARVYIFRPS